MWQELVVNEIWIKENYLSETQLSKLEKFFTLEGGYEMSPGDWIRECFKRSKVNPTLYSYHVHPSKLNDEVDMLDAIFIPIERLVSRNCPRNDLNELQLFLKSFSEKSFYDAHCEPQWRYGEYAFLLFLDDCRDGGELVFPNQKLLDQYLESHENQKKYFQDNIDILKSAGESVRLVGPCKVSPSRNMGVLFRTGSVHWVESLKNSQGIARRTLASWPFATNELIADLDRHCKIKDRFNLK